MEKPHERCSPRPPARPSGSRRSLSARRPRPPVFAHAARVAARAIAAASALLVFAACGSGGEREPRDANGRGREKMSSGLRAAFAPAPAVIEPGVPVALLLEISGRPGEELRVSFAASDGVFLDATAIAEGTGASESPELPAQSEIAVRLDGEGASRVEISATAPRPRGCEVLARVSAGDGRSAVAHCLLGGEAAAGKQGVLELPDGRKVRGEISR